MTEAAAPRALVVDDDLDSLHGLAGLVRSEGFEVVTAETLAEARAAIAESAPGLVLCDLILPDGQGTELLRDVEGIPDCEVILVTARASLETAVEALRRGAYDYVSKPVDVARLRAQLSSLSRTWALKSEVAVLRNELKDLGRFGPMVGSSSVMHQVFDLIAKVAPTSASVLITGPTGTGKELVAETLHRLSKRRTAPFVPINCGAVSPTLIESELFGHEKGAFTGADRRHIGAFERASSGTLFLDEITEMPIDLQVKLLRVLETGKVQRLGGTELIEVDSRILAACNRSPQEAVKRGELRQDLYYRLKVFPIEVPALRERPEDIETLAVHFLDQLNRKEGASKTFTESALAHLTRQRWPGNVRELKNVVHRGFILAKDRVTVGCLTNDNDEPPEIGGGGDEGQHIQVAVGSSIAETERQLIEATLAAYDGNKTQAAKVLEISLKTLYNRLNQYAARREGASEAASSR